MQRPHFRHSFPRPGGFRSPPPGMERGGGGGGMLPSPPWAYQNPPPPFGPRYGAYGGSPNTPPMDFIAGRGGSNGKYSGGRSQGHTPRWPNGGGGDGGVRGGTPHRHSPYYHSPGQHGGSFQGSPRTSTPFGRERGGNDRDKYYKPPMLQDPWATLQPISVKYGAGRGGSNGKYSGGRSPGHTPRWPNGGGGDGGVRGGTPHRHSPNYHSPGQHGGSFQGSPRTSTPFGRERGGNDKDKYYKPPMLQEPWATLQPISVTDCAGRGASNGKYSGGRSPGHTPRWPNGGGGGGGDGGFRGGTLHRHSPYYHSPGQHGRSFQGSPRTSTPFGRERGGNDRDKYYKPSMLQDPWANLQPISVTDAQSKSSTQQATNTGRQGRYYGSNLN